MPKCIYYHNFSCKNPVKSLFQLLILVCLFFACETAQQGPEPLPPGENARIWMPSDSKTTFYHYDSIIYNPFSGSADTSSGCMKRIWFPPDNGDDPFYVQQFYCTSSSDQWIPVFDQYYRQQGEYLLQSRENKITTVMRLPLSEQIHWDANLFNEKPARVKYAVSVNKPVSILAAKDIVCPCKIIPPENTVTFDNSVTIKTKPDSSMVYYRYAETIYAKNNGPVRHRKINLEHGGHDTSGFIFNQIRIH
jgi:hypothetical protein